MNFTEFVMALDDGRTPRGTRMEWTGGLRGYQPRLMTDEEYARSLMRTGNLGLTELQSCCGIDIIHNLAGMTDFQLQCVMQRARDAGYTVAMATDLTRRASKAILLRNGWTIAKTFTNRRTSHKLNVYTIDLYPIPDYQEIYERLKNANNAR